MRLRQYLEEEWVTKVKGRWGGSITDIFISPTKSDMAELGKEARFIADNRKKRLYVWNAHTAYHQDVAEKIFGSFDDTSDEKKLYGTAEQKGAKWKITSSDSYDGRPTPEEMMKEYKWMNKYIDINEFFNSWI